MRIKEQEKRAYYQKECIECAWSVRQLERQINSFYYERILATSEAKRDDVRAEIQVLEPNTDPKYLMKDPYILEFLGLDENKAYLEQELEQGLIDNLQSFFLELGKGFSFVARQKRHRARRIIPDCQTIELKESGHMHILPQTEKERIIEFLKK